MFTSATRFLLTLAASFALLLTMWVSAAHAAPGSHDSGAAQPLCRQVGATVVMCEGAGYQLPSAPRGTVRRLPKVSTHRVGTVRGESTVGARVGYTVIIARLGARG